MDFGERMQLSESEHAALLFGDVPLDREWPATEDAFQKLELLILERIVDKRGVLDEMRQKSELRHSPQEAFRLRRELGILYEAHDQLFAFAVEQGFDTSPPEVE